jgi:hypothetical protein
MPGSDAPARTKQAVDLHWSGSMRMAEGVRVLSTDCGSMSATDASTPSPSKCAASALCGLSTAPAPPGLKVVAPMEAGPVLFPHGVPNLGFVTDAPERPPRALA